MARSAWLAAALLLAFGCSEVRYTVRPIEDNSRIQVSMTFDAKPGPVELQMPNWSPGAYTLSVRGKEVRDFRCTDAAGNPVVFEHPADNSWKGSLAKAGPITVAYTVPARYEFGALHYSGPPTYLYIVGRKNEPCRLTLDLPKEWSVAVGLDPVGDSPIQYAAPNYDVLADNPVTAGDFIECGYTSHGRPVRIVLRGQDRAKVNQEQLTKLCKTISDCEGDFFGGVPYRTYVWHFGVGSLQGGGLEHLSSTQIALGHELGPTTAHVCAHELFHLWNVKRIRPRVLGPFDYTQLPRTGALYWMEGVTDYYASLLTLRCGLSTEEEFLKDAAEKVAKIRANPARLEVSPYESSLREPDENDGKGNGGGWRLNYYDAGWLVGLCLDLELRTRTHGGHSLDDVERALWDLCRDDQPGFEEGEIERQFVRLGGSREYFERVVMKPGELPVEEALERTGLRLVKDSNTFVDKGFDLSGTYGSPKVSVDSIRPFAAAAGLAEDDVLLEVNAKPVMGTTMEDSIAKASAALGHLHAGDSIKLKVRRGDAELDVTITAVEASVPVFRVVDDAAGDGTRLELRKRWYTGAGGPHGPG
jgi:predicted metalloprotease with PDZ domain